MMLFASPGGTVETVPGVDINRPCGTQALLRALYPAINRWAILNCPSGTKKTRRELLQEVYYLQSFLYAFA
jgi:hypothetical protein